MIVTFKSAACADVIYFGDVARRLLALIGKDDTDKGIVTLEQIPGAIKQLRAAIEADKAEHRQLVLAEAPLMECAGEGATARAGELAMRPRVSLTQRALPLLSLLEESLRENQPVVWGV